VRLTVERLGHHGDGIAAGPVFVPRTLPGEVVEGQVDAGRMAQPKIVTPSPDRVAPPCPHYRTCGGCQLQHAADRFVADWKTDVVRVALAAQGLEAPVRGVATSPARSRRRATLHGRRTKAGVIVGFHGRASGSLVAVPECRVLSPAIMAAFPALHLLTAQAASRRSEIDLAVTDTDAGLDVAVSGALPLTPEMLPGAIAIAEAHDLARLAWNGEVVAERRPPLLRLGPARVPLPPGAFLQATREGEAALLAAVTEAVGEARHVVDLFAGCGTFALPLSAAADVHAVEGEAALLSALDRGWRSMGGGRRVTTEARDLFRNPLRADELARFDAAVIDPPRAGAAAQTEALAASGIARIAAVSCNPVTFARDARTLVAAGFRLLWVQIVDQFRWSPHVELAAAFRRDEAHEPRKARIP
jgi:23S rRNA (uracil1939-C5)-methyltransferase